MYNLMLSSYARLHVIAMYMLMQVIIPTIKCVLKIMYKTICIAWLSMIIM